MLYTAQKNNLFALGVETHFFPGNLLDFEDVEILAAALAVTEEQLLINDKLHLEAINYIKRNRSAIEQAAATTRPYWRSLAGKLGVD